MENLSAHFVPLLFIPGVALLVLSTSNRLIHLNDRLLKLDLSEDPKAEEWVPSLKKRANLFRRALISLYICIAFFAFATLLNCFALTAEDVASLVRWTMVGGASFLFYAILTLISESWIAIQTTK